MFTSRSHISFTISRELPSWPRAIRLQKEVLSDVLRNNALDRVKVLDGHAGCVNALQWARDGELLLSAGDDTTVRIWRMDPGDTTQDYSYSCQTIIQTGHRANIFNAQMLPYSSRIATVAGDSEVRVFDVRDESTPISSSSPKEYLKNQATTHKLRCHEDRTKRIVTENSPDTFLTVSEDGTVRQHDLRTPHSCRSRCPSPILKIEHELSTLALSPLTPWQMVVAGASPYGYLFDRRYVARVLQEEWGMRLNGVTTCVRRFGRPSRPLGESSFIHEHITGARMASENGHEVLLSYSGDGVYLYSTLDEPEESSPRTPVLSSNVKRRKIIPSVFDTDVEMSEPESEESESDEQGGEEDENDKHRSEEDENEDDEDERAPLYEDEAFHPWVPVILPRKRYLGARNVDTVKDVNFLGPFDEYVTSGSDDGNFFIWNKATGDLCGIYEGDSSVVNVIEAHPYLPLVAVSGIDKTVKLFSITRGKSKFSRLADAENIMKTNQETRRTVRHIRRADFITLLASMQAASALRRSSADEEIEDVEPEGVVVPEQCINQ